MKLHLIALLALLPVPVQAADIVVAATGERMVIRTIHSTQYIEPVKQAIGAGILGSIIGTSIAASLQSQPIPLQPGTDYACKYQHITTVKVKNCGH